MSRTCRLTDQCKLHVGMLVTYTRAQRLSSLLYATSGHVQHACLARTQLISSLNWTPNTQATHQIKAHSLASGAARGEMRGSSSVVDAVPPVQSCLPPRNPRSNQGKSAYPRLAYAMCKTALQPCGTAVAVIVCLLDFIG